MYSLLQEVIQMPAWELIWTQSMQVESAMIKSGSTGFPNLTACLLYAMVHVVMSG